MLVAQLVKTLRDKQTADVCEINKHGNIIYRGSGSTGRYVVDFASDLSSECWEQFDTDQDAHYFGFWVNPVKLMTLTYIEGDWVLVVCPDHEHYLAEIQSAINFYGEGWVASTIDLDGTVTHYRQDRKHFLATR